MALQIVLSEFYHEAIRYQNMSGVGNRFIVVKQKTEVIPHTKRAFYFLFLTS